MRDPLRQDELEIRIRCLLLQDRLPRTVETKSWAGAGRGSCCGACDRDILPNDVEYELLFGEPGEAARRLTMHHGCEVIWNRERKAL
jgi:hypothetical protein